MPKKDKNPQFPEIIAGKVKADAKLVIQTVCERKDWSESQTLRKLVYLDAETVKTFREVWREIRTA